MDMNPSQSCRGSCKNYELTENQGCFKDKFCSQQPKCEGRIIDCQFIESDMKVCQSVSGEAAGHVGLYMQHGNNRMCLFNFRILEI